LFQNNAYKEDVLGSVVFFNCIF